MSLAVLSGVPLNLKKELVIMKTINILQSLAMSACVLVLFVLPAAALEKEDFDFLTTKHLYNVCSVTPDNGDYAVAAYACRGFIEGAVQYHDGISSVKNLKRLICYPTGTTLEEGRVAFIAWADSNMSNEVLMNELPVKGLVRALSEAYPCAK
jgi:hypothetical protein